MYTFAILAMLALATVKLVDFLSDNVPMLDRMRSLVTFIVGLGAVLWLDWSMFDGFHTAINNRQVGVWITGFCVAGMTVPWRAIFGFLTHDHAMRDETLGLHSPLRKVA
ncbi:MAG: hypothetical protein QOI47_741 [Actinomycetota bacterium]|jgi:hypothetical protein|nr:hypothetical protein [Actinomycetota bacterium]